MQTDKYFEQFKTDEDRFAHLHELAYYQWYIAGEWEDEAQTEKYKRLFRSCRVSLYHKEEAKFCGDV